MPCVWCLALIPFAAAQDETLPDGAFVRLGGGNPVAIAISPDGMRVVVSAWGESDATLRTWDVQSGEASATERLVEPERHLRFSADGTDLIRLESFDGQVRMRSLIFGEPKQLGAARLLEDDRFAFTPDARWVVCGGMGGTLWLYRPDEIFANGEVVEEAVRWIPRLVDHNPTALAFSPSGDLLALAMPNIRDTAGLEPDAGPSDEVGVLTLWDVNAYKMVEDLRVMDPLWKWGAHVDTALAVAFTPGDLSIAVRCIFGDIHLLDAATGRPVMRLDGHKLFKSREEASFADSPGRQFLTFARGGRLLISGSEDGTLEVWDAAEGKRLAAFEGCRFPIDVTPDGRFAASGDGRGGALVWRLPDPPALRSDADPEVLWTEMGGDDPARAYRSQWALAGTGAAELIRGKFHQLPDGLIGLIGRLDDESAAARGEAARDLALLGWRAEAALRRVVERPSSPEQKARAEVLLKRLDGPIAPGRVSFKRAELALQAIETP